MLTIGQPPPASNCALLLRPDLERIVMISYLKRGCQDFGSVLGVAPLGGSKLMTSDVMLKIIPTSSFNMRIGHKGGKKRCSLDSCPPPGKQWVCTSERQKKTVQNAKLLTNGQEQQHSWNSVHKGSLSSKLTSFSMVLPALLTKLMQGQQDGRRYNIKYVCKFA